MYVFYQQPQATHLPLSLPSLSHRRPPPPPPACFFKKDRVSAFSQSRARGEYIWKERRERERRERAVRDAERRFGSALWGGSGVKKQRSAVLARCGSSCALSTTKNDNIHAPATWCRRRARQPRAVVESGQREEREVRGMMVDGWEMEWEGRGRSPSLHLSSISLLTSVSSQACRSAAE